MFYNQNKIRIKLKQQKDSEAIWVYVVDAKEIIDQGDYVMVTDQPVVDKVTTIESDVITIEQINSMTTKELEQLVKDNSLDIEDFSKMNLKDKREAVINSFNDVDL